MTLDEEYAAAWTTVVELFKIADALGVPFALTLHFGLLGTARVLVEGRRYQPHDRGEWALLVAIRGDPDGHSECDDPFASITSGLLLDIVAIPLRSPNDWALRRGSVTHVGAVEPQILGPDPVPVWRSPLAWLRSGCVGVALLTDDSREQASILRDLAGIISEDAAHGREIKALLERPFPTPPILVRAE